MASQKFYHDLLLDLHLRQTHDLRVFLQTKKNLRRKPITREFLKSQIEILQFEITKEDIKESFKHEFNKV